MSALVSLDGWHEVASADVAPEWTPFGRLALVAQLWELAGDLGSLRRDGAVEWVCDRAAGRLETCLNIVCPTAAEYVRAGIDVDQALEIVDERADRVRRLTGAAP